MNKINETFVKQQIIEFMENKEDGNWHTEKTKNAGLHEHGPDIKLIGAKETANTLLSNVKVNHMPNLQNLLNQLIKRAGSML